MKVVWTRAALADVEGCVPAGFRPALAARLQGMMFLGQGRRCLEARFQGARFLKFRYWLVMYVPVEEDTIAVVAVEYNYGQGV
ncbi:MAG: hypothetical protein VKQ33_01065 [Candidatus Sericytochromatia bacterium]|nr:hypothetical protein [Candidatus Sericytochromatia bacterium]